MNQKKFLLKANLLGAVALLVTTQVFADAIVSRTREQNNFTFAQGAPVLVPLTVAGAVRTPAFNTSGAIRVTYEAECAVAAAAGNTTTWLDIDIQLVDLATNTVVRTLPPSNGTADALCTSNGTAGADGWTRSTITGLATGLPVGSYAIQIQATIQNGVAGNSGWLGDSTLIVWK